MAHYEIKVQDIFYEIARVLKAIYPNKKLKVHQERIADLKTPAMSIELVQYSTPQFSQSIINKRVDLDIIYYAESDTVHEALTMVSPLMSAFSMGLTVYSRDLDGNIERLDAGEIANKRFIHCLRPPEYTLVDQDLHFMVTLEWADSYRPVYVTLDEEVVDGKLYEKEAMVTSYNTADETLENKEIDFVNDEDETNRKDYINGPYSNMEELHSNINNLYASIEFKKG